MLTVYDDNDNIKTESVHNAEMVSAYLSNLAIDFYKFISDENCQMLWQCSEFLWSIKDNLPEK